MKKGWVEECFGDVCNFVRGPFGGSLKKSVFVNDGIAVYEQQHAIYNQFEHFRYFITDEKFENMKRFEVKFGDLIMSCSGTIGKVAIVPANARKGIINQALLKLSPNRLVEAEYLKYWMESNDFNYQIALHSKGAAIKNVASVKILKEIHVPLPSIDEQKRIIANLDRCFEAIEKAKANVKCNLQNAKELFQSQLNQIFFQKGEEWVEKKFGEVCTLQRGFDLPTRLRTKGKYSLVSSSGISDSINEFKVKAPGVTTGRSGSIGNVFYIEDDFWPLNTVLYIKDFHNNYERFIYYLLIFFDLEKYASGAGVPTLNRNFVHGEKVNVPVSFSEQEGIVNQLDGLSEEIKNIKSHYQQELDALDELKKSILQKAFNGELTTITKEATV